MMKRMICMVLVTMLLLVGCVFPEPIPEVSLADLPYFDRENGAAFSFDSSVTGTPAQSSIGAYLCDAGIFSYDFENRLMMFEDFATGDVMPMCARPNCTHNSESCAAFSKTYIEFPYYDGTYFYFYTQADNTFYRQRPDGTERRAVFSLDVRRNKVNSMGLWAVFEDGKMYFTTATTEFQREDNTQSHSLGVAVVELATGDVTTVPVAFPGEMADVQLLGKVGNYLVFLHHQASVGAGFSVTTPQQTIFTFNLETGELTGFFENYLSAGANNHITLDGLSCGLLGSLEFNTADAYQALGYTWYPGKLVVADISKQTEYVLTDIPMATWSLTAYNNGFVWETLSEDHKEIVWMYYDLSTGVVTAFDPWQTEYAPVAQTENAYICTHMEDGEFTYWRIPKEDHHKGSGVPVQVFTFG